MSETILYDYWRSSASYRVRIALNLIGVEYRIVPVNLLTGEHREEAHRERNRQALVPALQIDGMMLTQSLAIIEYLAESRGNPGFLPDGTAERAHARALAYAIAMEIHPICNLSVAGHAMKLGGGDDQVRIDWMRHYIGQGLAHFEAMLADSPPSKFCHGDQPGMADFCLVPQIYNARRWGADFSGLTRTVEIAERCEALEAFRRAHPDAVKPAS